MAKIKIDGFGCDRCGHQWAPREPGQPPTVCPKCKSPYWDRPRQSDLRAAGYVKSIYTKDQLHGKRVEFELLRDNSNSKGLGEFNVEEGTEGLLRVSIKIYVAEDRSELIQLTQEEVSHIENHTLSRKSRFRCVFPQ